MRECSRHPSETQPGGGVCARCLEERLLRLWKGESFRGEEQPEVSVASVRQQRQVHGVAARASAAGVSTHHHTSEGGGAAGLGMRGSVMEEWCKFHARRRREQDSAKSKSFDSEESRPPELVVLMNAQKMRSRSMPLDIRSAEDTAQRVINEQGDDLFFDDDLDAYAHHHRDDGDDSGGVELDAPQQPLQRCFSPKWVKVLVSPMTASSRNRVFPSSRSKEDARKGRGSRKRGAARFDSSDWGVKQWPPRPTMRSSVFSWLQDADTTYQKKCDQEVTLSSSCSSTDSWLRDLTTVGHLHEIAEELEIEEESTSEDEDEEEVVGDMSFGKFLLSAAQRQPEAHLTRLVSAAHSK